MPFGLPAGSALSAAAALGVCLPVSITSKMNYSFVLLLSYVPKPDSSYELPYTRIDALSLEARHSTLQPETLNRP